ncbi:MAG: DMT family transporter [Rubrivivax sp.]|nr:DMT family transporter [Rubrivivax sp.]
MSAGAGRALAGAAAHFDTLARRRGNARGVRLMVAGMACFIVNDTLVKVASSSLPAGQLIFVRGLMATVLVLAVMRLTRVPLVPRQLATGWVPVRATLDAMATLCYLVSLFHLPLANATAINMATPLVITALSVWWLRERVGPQRWLAIAAGFAGVLLVIQPRGEGFNAFAWLCLLATVLHALRDLATLRIRGEVPSLTVTLATAVAVTLWSLALSLGQGWVPMRAPQLALLAAAAVFLAGGYQLVIAATRAGELSVVAPFRYSGLVMAVMLGYVVWGDVPNGLAWAGIALVLATGLTLMRQGSR